MLAVVPGLGYETLRSMPLPELYTLRREVAEIARKRAKANRGGK